MAQRKILLQTGTFLAFLRFDTAKTQERKERPRSVMRDLVRNEGYGSTHLPWSRIRSTRRSGASSSATLRSTHS